MELFRKIKRKFNKLCFAPLDIFVFHAVSDKFDPERNYEMDWTGTKQFKTNIRSLKQSYEFISLQEAYNILRRCTLVRRKRYAVLTCDDGYACMLDIIPWLEEQKVPLTLFINPRALEPGYFRPDYPGHPDGLYITKEQLDALSSPWISIGSHGYEHTDAKKMSPAEFDKSISRCIEILGSHPRTIPFHAYTWGSWNKASQDILAKHNIIPVLTDGASNYKLKASGLSRKPIDGKIYDF